MIIGLTGGIASGKSTVSTMFKELKIPVVDADVIAREVVVKGEETLGRLVTYFGTDILTSDGYLDRKKLGAIVFSDQSKRIALNEIIHPAIRQKMSATIKALQEEGFETIVVDIPLLFESKLTQMVDKIIVVYVDEALQRERLQARDQLSVEEVNARIQAQMPLSSKITLADEVIYNHKSLQETKRQLLTILDKWKS